VLCLLKPQARNLCKNRQGSTRFSKENRRYLQTKRAAAEGGICVQSLFPSAEQWSALAHWPLLTWGLLLQAGGPWCFCTLFVLCFLWAETPIFLPSATPTWPAASKIKRTVDDLHVVDLIMDFPGCHIVLPPQGNNGRPEILKFSLMFMLSHSQNGCQAIPIGSMYAIYGNIYHQYTPNVSIYIYIYHTWILWDRDSCFS